MAAGEFAPPPFHYRMRMMEKYSLSNAENVKSMITFAVEDALGAEQILKDQTPPGLMMDGDDAKFGRIGCVRSHNVMTWNK